VDPNVAPPSSPDMLPVAPAPEPPPPPPPYPRALVDRPHVLPDGLGELGLGIETQRYEFSQQTYYAAALTAGIGRGFGNVELSSGLVYLLGVSGDVPVETDDRLVSLGASAEYAITPDVAIEIGGAVVTPGMIVHSKSAGISASGKTRIPQLSSAVFASVSASYAAHEDTTQYANDNWSTLAFSATAQYEVQVTPTACFYALGLLQKAVSVDAPTFAYNRPQALSHQVGGGIVASVSPRVDLTTSLVIVTSSDVDLVVLSGGIVLRSRR
jgi:hypothetical protein